MTQKAIPRKLYKYRKFSVNTLKLFETGYIYYSEPQYFNDPLDCDPTILIDIDIVSLEDLCYSLLVSEKDADHAEKKVKNLRYMTTQYGDYKTEPDAKDYNIKLLASEVKRSIDKELKKNGIFCLSENWECPLMWSHYADDHRGVCIEFDTSDFEHPWMKPVDYNAPRSVKASDLVDWKINGSRDARSRVFNTYFLSKANQWSYEDEWRDINGTSGSLPSQFRIAGIYFGLRCDSAVISALVNLFRTTEHDIDFYQIVPLDDSFNLHRRILDDHDLASIGVRESPFFSFKDIIVTN